MRWRGARRSTNIEDRSGEPPAVRQPMDSIDGSGDVMDEQAMEERERARSRADWGWGRDMERIDGRLSAFREDVLAEFELVKRKLEQIIKSERAQLRQGEAAMATHQEILDEVRAQTTVVGAVKTLVERLVAEQDPAVRQQIADELFANKAVLESALLAGTPQDPAGGVSRR